MAIKTKAQLASESASTFVDNSTGFITPSLHRTYNTDTIDSFLSVKDASELQAVMLENRANSISSGTTVDLSGANGNLVHITGTSTITSFGSVQAGARFVLVFDGILLLTYNATSLILPTSANITTAVGDTAFMISEGSGNWRCVAYQRASGAALVGGGGGSGTVTSVALTMPSAFSVANSPVTTSGSLDVTAIGVASQYIRGDGQLANFPTSTGGGASVNYYLNGSVSQGTFGGIAMREINKVPVIGTGTDFTINADGYIQSFITDANDPNQLEIPAGNWNFETYFSSSSSGGSPSFYVELYKWNGATLTLIASNSATPEYITGGTAIDLYLTALAVPQTPLAITDRLVVRIWVNHSSKTIKLHTENSHLSQIITTFSTGLTSLNGLTEQTQYFATGTDFASGDWFIDSVGDTHTFNIPNADVFNRGLLTAADWVTFDSKYDNPTGTTSQYIRGDGTFAALPCEIQLAASDETTALTAGANKMTFRMPYAMTLTGIRASLTTAQPSGASLLTVDVNQNGTSILSTKLTFDNTEKTTVLAGTQPVISTSALTDDAEITIDIDQIGTSGAAGLKLTLKGTRS
jgi:hypothetical protein